MSEPVLGVAPVPGLDISGVLYRYTAVKERPDDFTVTVSNQNAIDGGYIFRETDDWLASLDKQSTSSYRLDIAPSVTGATAQSKPREWEA